MLSTICQVSSGNNDSNGINEPDGISGSNDNSDVNGVSVVFV